MIFWRLLLFAILGLGWADKKAEKHHPSFATVAPKNPEELNPEFWRKSAQDTLKGKLKEELNTNLAKNVIFFIGDGMDLQTVAATRMYLESEESYLSFENFLHVGLVSVYAVNRKVPDSACTATAYLAGVKGNYGTTGLNAQVPRYDCVKSLNPEHFTENIVKWAQTAGKSTGVITTTKITHATPAGAFSHTANRYWESDADVAEHCDPRRVPDIAQQLITLEVGQNLNVIMGGGRKMFLDESMTDEEGYPGHRLDRKNYIQEWQNIKRQRSQRYEYVWNKTRLNQLDYDQTDYLMGLFESDHCYYNLEIKKNNLKEEPTLTEMVEAGIKVLSKNPNGFFLFVEGGKIDVAHHETFTQHALEETAEMARAVAKALEMTNDNDTLTVVSADHGHSFTYNGYQERGADILGAGDKSDLDFIPYSALSYANGRGYYNTYAADGSRIDMNDLDYKDLEFRYPSTVPFEAASHGGQHIGVWANGPWSHLFVGTHEQNALPMMMAYASKMGPFASKNSALSNSFSKFIATLLIMSWIRKYFL